MALYQFKDNRWPVNADIVTLTRDEARVAWKLNNILIMHSGTVLQEDSVALSYYRSPGPFVQAEQVEKPEYLAPYNPGSTFWKIVVPPWEGKDLFLQIHWQGDVARMYEDTEILSDDFYTGQDHVWEIGLKRFGVGKAHTFIMEIEPLYKDTKIFLEQWPVIQQEPLSQICWIRTEVEQHLYCVLNPLSN
jgi:hypothetical protein